MSYSEFQKAHPHWPKRMKDLVGHKVRLTEKQVSYGGDAYEAGHEFKVTGSWRSKLNLVSLSRKVCRNPMGLRMVPVRSLELCE